MKKKTRLIKLENGFNVLVTVKETGSNYNQFACICKGEEEMPLFGTTFKNTDTNENIKEWANERINAKHNNETLQKYFD